MVQRRSEPFVRRLAEVSQYPIDAAEVSLWIALDDGARAPPKLLVLLKPPISFGGALLGTAH